MNDFDLAARHAVKLAPVELIRWLFPRLAAPLAFRRWLDSQSAPRPGEPDRRCDTIAEVVDAGGTSPPWAVVVELFTAPDADAVDRALEYIGRFRREVRHGPRDRDRYLFAVALVFLTRAPAEVALHMRLPGQEDVELMFRPRVVVMADESAVALLERIEQNQEAQALLPWAALMRQGNEPVVIARWRARLEREPDEQRRRLIVSLALIFADLTDGHDAWRKGLEGLDVQEATLLREARNEARNEARREDLLRVLKARFPNAVTPPLEDRVRQQADTATLSKLFDLALSATSLDQFEAALTP